MYPLLISALVIFAVVTIVFFIALLRRDNSVMDIAYGLVFIMVALVLFFISDFSYTVLVTTLLVVMWGVRLSGRIYIKNRGKQEDRRYANWREEWNKKGHTYFIIRSYLQIFLLQGLIIWLVSLPVVFANTTSSSWGILTTLGLGLWVGGFLFESVADYQLDRFLKNPHNRGEIMTHGLFRYSRRPNYFGESLMWWGLALIVFSNPTQWVVFISPLTITYIVVFVTGPLTEKLWDGNEAYQMYKKRTSYFIPLPPRKI